MQVGAETEKYLLTVKCDENQLKKMLSGREWERVSLSDFKNSESYSLPEHFADSQVDLEKTEIWD